MARIYALVLTAAMSLAGIGMAQTGPVGPATNNNPAPTLSSETSGRMTPDHMAQYLKELGHTVETRTAQNGAITLLASIKNNGWTFQVEFSYTVDQMSWTAACILGNAPTSPAQLTEILKLNHKLAPSHFSYRETDRKLLFESPLYLSQIREGDFQLLLERLLKDVRDTHPIWSGSQVSTTPSVPTPPLVTAPKTNPTNATTNPQTATQGLVNTTWTGSENLQTFGRLQFRFLENGKVLMIDTSGESMGTYTQQGQNVALTFVNGDITYAGTINGNVFSGAATNKVGARWSFSVSK